MDVTNRPPGRPLKEVTIWRFFFKGWSLIIVARTRIWRLAYPHYITVLTQKLYLLGSSCGMALFHRQVLSYKARLNGSESAEYYKGTQKYLYFRFFIAVKEHMMTSLDDRLLPSKTSCDKSEGNPMWG